MVEVELLVVDGGGGGFNMAVENEISKIGRKCLVKDILVKL